MLEELDRRVFTNQTHLGDSVLRVVVDFGKNRSGVSTLRLAKPDCHIAGRSLAAGMAWLLAATAGAMAEEGRARAADAIEVICVAGCGGSVPKVVFNRPFAIHSGAAPLVPEPRGYQLFRGIWCGEHGTCTAQGSRPKQRHDHGPHSPVILVFGIR